MSVASALNSAARIIGTAAPQMFPDRLTVQTLNESAGTGGMKIKSSTTSTYSNVPCIVELIQKFAWRKDQGEKNLSTQKYTVTTPTFLSGSRITINPATQRLLVAARDGMAAFTLRIDSTPDDMGVVYVMTCSKEN